MKNFTLTLLLVLGLTGSPFLQAATTSIVVSATEPTIGSDDVSNFVTPSGHYNGGYDFTNNYSNGAGSPGQTFTVTSSGLLSAVTIQGLEGQAGLGYQAGTFTLGVYSVASDGTDLTYLGGGNFTFANTSTSNDYSGDYLTFDLSSTISVAAGSEYAFAISSSSGYYALAGSETNTQVNPYADGSAIVVGGGSADGGHPVSASNTTISGTLAYDRNFDIAISETPEPATWAMLIGGLLSLIVIQRCRRARIDSRAELS